MTMTLSRPAAYYTLLELPNARSLARFEMGDAEPMAGVITYKGGPVKGLKGLCYLSASGCEVIVLKPKFC